MVEMAEGEITATLDIREEFCPVSMVKTKMKLEELKPGDILEVLLNDGEPATNVPKGVRSLGHKVLTMTREGDKYRLLIKKEAK